MGYESFVFEPPPLAFLTLVVRRQFDAVAPCNPEWFSSDPSTLFGLDVS